MTAIRLQRILLAVMVGFALLWTHAAESHDTDHDYAFMENGVIKVGREEQAGGCVVWLSEKDGRNLVSNRDLGRQIQSAVFDTLAWNPTQAGDGPNQSITEIFDVRPDYIYSKCIPLHYVDLTWYLQPEPRKAPEPRVCENQRFHMWSEFLPNSGGRAVWVRTVWESWSDHKGQVCAQCVHPIAFTNRYFNKAVTYSGPKPWTGDAMDVVIDEDTTDITGPMYLMTELWQGVVNDDNYGVMLMSASSNALWWDMNDRYPGPDRDDDHMKRLCYIGPLDYFPVGINKGEKSQVREGATIFYLGEAAEARKFFATYRPRLSADFSDDFNDGDHHDWIPNSRPTHVSDNVVSMGPSPDPPYPQDLSLLRRYYGDAAYTVRVKMANGKGWAGLCVRKPGEGHYWGVKPSGYIAALEADGNVSVRTNGQTLASAPVPEFAPDAWHTLSVVAKGLDLDIRVDGKNALMAHDPMERYAAGFVSLAAGPEAHALFDDVSIKAAEGDNEPPDKVRRFKVKAAADGKGLNLEWSNPDDEDWRFTRIIRKEGEEPDSPYDGFPCYEGKLSAYRDLDVASDTRYFYAAYAWDHAGNYAAPATASAKAAGSEKSPD